MYSGASYLRTIATELEGGCVRMFETEMAIMLAYSVMGEKAYPCHEIFPSLPDDGEMVMLWLAVAILEDQERTQRIKDALDLLRRESLR